MAWPPTTHQDVQDAVNHLRGGIYRVDDYGADPTGATDSTNAIKAAVAAMPTRTVYATPSSSSGASAVYPLGTLQFGAGIYRVGTSGDIGNLGPLVTVLGQGVHATTIDYRGAGDCLRIYNAVLPSDDNFDTIAAWAGTVNLLTIDGTNAGVGARGLHLGDTEGAVLGPSLRINNFTGGQVLPPGGAYTWSPSTTGGTIAAGFYAYVITAINASGETMQSNTATITATANQQVGLGWNTVTGATGYKVYRGTSGGGPFYYLASVATNAYTDTGGTAVQQIIPPQGNVTGGIGLHLDNAVSWTENITGRVQLYNCDNAVVMSHTTAAAADWSMEYNDLTFKIYSYAQQQGVVLRNGVGYNNGRLVIRANMANNSAPATNAALTLFGNAVADGTGQPSVIIGSRLDIQAETNLGGAYPPVTITLANPYTGGNAIQQCTGVLRFFHTWTQSSWSAGGPNSPNFQFAGVISGDTNLHPAAAMGGGTAAAFAVSGALGLATTAGWYSGSTLNLQFAIGDIITGTLTTNSAIAFTQTMPGAQRKVVILKQDATGGRTVTWPAGITWVSGTATAMPTAANASQVFEFFTADGTAWYGR